MIHFNSQQKSAKPYLSQDNNVPLFQDLSGGFKLVSTVEADYYNNKFPQQLEIIFSKLILSAI